MVRARSSAAATAWMCTAHILSMTGFSVYPTLLPQLQREWALSNSQAGFVVGAFFAGYMLAVPALTILTDRLDARRVYIGASVVSAIGPAGFALLAQGTPSAALFQLLAGAGVAGTYMPGLKLLTDSVGAGNSRAVSLYTACFGFGVALSIFGAGELAAAYGWRAAFACAALGPLVSVALVLLGTTRSPIAAGGGPAILAGIVQAWRNDRARPYILGYAAHTWELFGTRSWLVAFLAFAQGGTPWAVSPVAIAAIGNMAVPFASVLGNEIALRTVRGRFIRIAMAASGTGSCLLGFLSGLPWPVLFAIVLVHMMLVNGDSGSLTSAVIAAARPELRGTTLAIHSTLGFGAGFVAPLVFGVVLDLAGPGESAWGVAFAVLGVVCVLAALVLRMRD